MDITVQPGGISFRVRVVPRANRDAVEGVHDGVLRVRVRAPPVDDRANEAVRRLLGERLHVPASAVTITSGATSRTKRVSIAGVTRDQVMRLSEGA